MATVVAIMDRASFGANTDVIVVARPASASLLWVPRDLWCERLGDRINRAYARGEHECLLEALAEHEIRAEHSVCLARRAVERVAADVVVAMPVREPLDFWYPLAPDRPLSEGRKQVSFRPPVERLEGERVHQWIGARMRIGVGSFGDLDRIRRQQELVAVLLGEGFHFAAALAEPEDVRISSPSALDELSEVRAAWRFETVSPLVPAEMQGKQVLTRGPI